MGIHGPVDTSIGMKMSPIDHIEDSEFSFFHYPKHLSGHFNVNLFSGFPMKQNSKIDSIYIISIDFNDVDSVSVAKSYTKTEIKNNMFFIKIPIQPKQNYLTLPPDKIIILRLLVNINTGKFIFSLADNVMDVNKYIEKVKVNLFYKLNDL